MAAANNLRYPSLIEALVLVVLLIVLQMLCGLAVIYWGSGYILSADNPISFVINLYIIPLLTGAMVITYALWRSETGWIAFLTEKKLSFRLYLLMLPATVGLSMLLSEVDSLIRTVYPVTGIWSEVFENIYQANLFTSFIGIVIIPSVIEEIIFRGIILKGFLGIYKPLAAIALSSLLFAVIHINVWQMATAFLAGLFIGWIYYRSRSLFIVIFIHGLFNTIAVLGNRLISIQEMASHLANRSLWLTLAGIIILAATSHLFNKRLKTENARSNSKIEPSKKQIN